MFGPPPPFFFGANPYFPPPVIITPQIIVQQPVVVQQPIVQARADVPVEPVKVSNPERFIVIQPGAPANNAGGNPARVEKPVKEVDLGVRPAELPLAPRRASNPLAEADQRNEDGRAAFARGEYGRALEHFRRAVLIAPAESTGYFLLSQAQFAAGKYDEAVGSITLGVDLRRDWPMSRFDSRALYKQNGAAFDFHVRNLRAALEELPDDPRLLFLLGVELWFDDRRAEAGPLFQKAARFARDPTPILAFLAK
jgi:tetratricopeptide (TPR) repeat protein